MADISKLLGVSGGKQKEFDLNNVANSVLIKVLKIDAISEQTDITGVTIDSLLIKDGKLGTADSVVESNITNSAVTNAKLAGSIVDSKLNQLTTANKVAGSAVQLNAGSTLVNDTGLKVGANLVNANIDAGAAIALSKLAALTVSRALYSDASGEIKPSLVTDTELGYLDGVTSAIQTQLNALSTGYGRRKKVISYITDNTAVPPSEVSSDRYILSHNGGAPHANWDGASANDIVEFNGTIWVTTSPLEGYICYNDADNKDYLQIDDGTPQWEKRATQTTALTDGKIWVGNVSNESAEQVVSGDITISNGGVVSISAGVIINADVKADAAIVTTKLADATEIAESVTFFGASDITGAEAETLSDGSIADTLHKHRKLYQSLTNNTGAQIDAGDVVCLSTTVAGEIVLADADAIATAEGTVGVVVANIADSASGEVQIAGEATVDNAAVNFDLGKEVFLSATAGKGTKTSPSSSGQHSVVLGKATATDKIIIGIAYRFEIA